MTGTQVIAVLSLMILASVITLLVRLNPKNANEAWEQIWGYLFGGTLLLIIVAILLPVFGMPLVKRGAQNWFGAAKGPITVVWELVTTVSRNDRLDNYDYDNYNLPLPINLPTPVPTISDFQDLMDEVDSVPTAVPSPHTQTTVVISGTERITTVETIAPPTNVSPTSMQTEARRRAARQYKTRLEEAQTNGDITAGITIVEEMLTDPLLSDVAAATEVADTTLNSIRDARQTRIRWQRLWNTCTERRQFTEFRRALAGYSFVVTEVQASAARSKWGDYEWAYLQVVSPGWLYGTEFKIRRGFLFEMDVDANRAGAEFSVVAR